MPDYHIGSLDEASKKALADGETEPKEDSSPRPIFLDPKSWRKGFLHSKKTVSWDTRIFTYKLEHEEQKLGLPTGQHLMMRLRDPVTREAIIRSYTPISQTTNRGFVDILIKIYFDTPSQPGGKMTKAMDSLPLGHFVDFKGPIGKFEYLSAGRCSVNGTARDVKRFVMITGGSGITPIYQVLRAVMQDASDRTTCTVLDGNRLLEDILCKEDLDAFARDNKDKCELLYLLTQPPDGWTGLTGRIGKSLLEQYAQVGEGAMCLICGPGPMEKSVHKCLKELGWRDEDLLFF